MKYIVLLVMLFLLSFSDISFSEFPQEHPDGLGYVSLSDTVDTIDAWGWRNAGYVWVELQNESSGFGTNLKIEIKHIKVVQDDETYTNACLALDKYKECGAFEMSPGNSNSIGKFVYRLDYISSGSDDPGFDFKNELEIFYKDDTTAIYIDASLTAELGLTAEPEGTGSVAGAGLYEAKEIVQLSATPTSGYRFSHWGDDTSDKDENKTYEMPGYKDDDGDGFVDLYPVDIVAHFVLKSENGDLSDKYFDGCFIDTSVCSKE